MSDRERKSERKEYYLVSGDEVRQLQRLDPLALTRCISLKRVRLLLEGGSLHPVTCTLDPDDLDVRALQQLLAKIPVDAVEAGGFFWHAIHGPILVAGPSEATELGPHLMTLVEARKALTSRSRPARP
jgi:hypothetical protein